MKIKVTPSDHCLSLKNCNKINTFYVLYYWLCWIEFKIYKSKKVLQKLKGWTRLQVKKAYLNV